MSYEVSREIGLPQPDIKKACSILLQSSEVNFNGWLRKQSSIQKKVKLFSGIIPWTQKYVVLHRGCMYIYENETSKRPVAAFTLFGYNQIARAGEVTTNEAPWAFKMQHIDQKKKHIFSAGSEREQKEWMLKIKDEMLYANNKPRLGMNTRSITSMDMSAVEDYVYASNEALNFAGNGHDDDDDTDYQIPKDEPPKISRLSSTSIRRDMPLPAVPRDTGGGHVAAINEIESDTDSEDSYNSIDPNDVETRRAAPVRPVTKEFERPPPPLPSSNTSRHNSGGSLNSPTSPNSVNVHNLISKLNTNHIGAGKPVPAAKPSPGAPKPPPRPKANSNSEDSFWEDVHWGGTDKEEANRVISDIGEDGVYLIRGDADKVLVVYSELLSRKYKIENIGGEFWISKETTFRSIKALIDHYTVNSLPRRSTQLRTPYKKLM